MNISASSPFNPSLEASYLLNAKCPDYLGQIWKARENDDLTFASKDLLNRVFDFIKSEVHRNFNLEFKHSDLLNSAYSLAEKAFSKIGADSEIFGMKYEGTKAYEKALHLGKLVEQLNSSKTFERAATVIDQLKEAHFVSDELRYEMEKPNVIPMSLSEFRKVSNVYKDEYARDVSAFWASAQHEYRQNLGGLSHDSSDLYISPLFLKDIETVIKREQSEIARYRKIEQEKFFKQFPTLKLDRCLNVDFSVQPLEGSSNPSAGSYSFIRSCLSLGRSEFLEKTNELLGFTKLKIIETGISTSLLIYNHDGTPFAIFKPSSFAGGSLENPKGTQVAIGSDIIEQASLKEVAASKVMNSISGAPETHLVEINLGGKVFQGSLQAYVPHNRSVDKLQYELLYIIADALDIDMPRGVLERISRGEAVSMQEQIKFGAANQKYMMAIMGSSYGMFMNQQALKNYYKDVGRILPEEVQQVGLHQLMTGNTDMNPANFLLAEKSDGGQQLIPVDFNLAFQKERAPNMAMMSIAFWLTHPYANAPMDQALIDYFKGYGVQAMAQQLRELGLDEERVINFELRATLIQKAVSEGLTLAETAYLFVPRVIKGPPTPPNPMPQMEETISEKLISSFYKTYDQAHNQEAKESARAQYREDVAKEIDALVKRLSDPKSFESRMREIQKSMLTPHSLKEFEQSYLEMRGLTGIDLVMPNFELATDKQIEEDKQGICLPDFPNFLG